MDSIYIVIVLVLLGLAALDLWVGVANDAVNFLNSSIGSKVAPLWVILTVASAGVLIGSMFSSGMMEIARSGVFYPDKFTFNDIMLLFLAVMITDVILLDIFNTLGLPTSTTVSLVFELLGAAVAVSLFSIWNTNPEAILSDYINTAKALKIISGIFISVGVAFAVGTIVMYLSRLLFSFNYKKSFIYIGAIWGGIALTAITYFAVFKGLKSTTLISKDALNYLQDNMSLVLLYTFIGWSAIMAVMQHIFKINILVIIILSGTAALALSFAGNDLVNFIGVFMAGLSSFQFASEFAAQGGDISTLYMSRLSEPVSVDWRYLFGAGLIMITALWLSKKARSVTKTEVNLARQGEGIEQFNSIGASRSLVRSALNFSKVIDKITPSKVKIFVESRFEPLKDKESKSPSFDMIRASVNLTVAALLISLGTSLKLPLSTTYVTFMVAMGSSLADRAWGRESAVYRITGVLTVIGGWFITAFVAFTVAAIVAFTLMYGGIYAIIGLIILVAYLLIQFTIIHKKREKNAETEHSIFNNEHDVIVSCTQQMQESVETTIHIYQSMLNGLFNEDRKQLLKLFKEADDFHSRSKKRRKFEVLPTLQQLPINSLDVGQYYVQMVDYFYEISKSLREMTQSSYQFIDDNHEGFSEEQIQDLKMLGNELLSIYNDLSEMMKTNDYSKFDTIKERRDLILSYYSEIVKKQILRAKMKDSGTRNSILFLNILNETKAMGLKSTTLMKAQRNMYNSDDFAQAMKYK